MIECILCQECSSKPSARFLDLYSNVSLSLGIREIINKHFGPTTAENNNEIKHICMTCWKVVRDFNTLHERVQYVQKEGRGMKINQEAVQYPRKSEHGMEINNRASDKLMKGEPKKRGRPRKSDTSIIKQESGKRGRPRKSTSFYFKLNSGKIGRPAASKISEHGTLTTEETFSRAAEKANCDRVELESKSFLKEISRKRGRPKKDCNALLIEFPRKRGRPSKLEAVSQGADRSMHFNQTQTIKMHIKAESSEPNCELDELEKDRLLKEVPKKRGRPSKFFNNFILKHIPRKRGRPSKLEPESPKQILPDEINDVVMLQSPEEKMEDNSSLAEIPRKRGRPRNLECETRKQILPTGFDDVVPLSPEENCGTDEMENNSLLKEIPRKRGRPSNFERQTCNQILTNGFDDVVVPDTVDEEENPNCQPLLPIESNELKFIPSLSNGLPRKRGRPRKSEILIPTTFTVKEDF